ncbi:MAG: hypothetical protein Q8L34_06110, partial [Candidatus Woesearchaeota archaeon]|nr:hypothetical protein [Candidatus Woesearchaeota archaeon]
MKLNYFLSILCILFFISIFTVTADPFTTTMEEGQEENFTLGSSFFDIEVMIIEDSTPATVTFRINTQITPQMIDSQSFVLQDGSRIFIDNITLNEGGKA